MDDLRRCAEAVDRRVGRGGLSLPPAAGVPLAVRKLAFASLSAAALLPRAWLSGARNLVAHWGAANEATLPPGCFLGSPTRSWFAHRPAISPSLFFGVSLSLSLSLARRPLGQAWPFLRQRGDRRRPHRAPQVPAAPFLRCHGESAFEPNASEIGTPIGRSVCCSRGERHTSPDLRRSHRLPRFCSCLLFPPPPARRAQLGQCRRDIDRVEVVAASQASPARRVFPSRRARARARQRREGSLLGPSVPRLLVSGVAKPGERGSWR